MTWPLTVLACTALAALTSVAMTYVRLYFAGALDRDEARFKQLEAKTQNLTEVVTANAVALKRIQDRETGSALKALKL